MGFTYFVLIALKGKKIKDIRVCHVNVCLQIRAYQSNFPHLSMYSPLNGNLFSSDGFLHYVWNSLDMLLCYSIWIHLWHHIYGTTLRKGYFLFCNNNNNKNRVQTFIYRVFHWPDNNTQRTDWFCLDLFF